MFHFELFFSSWGHQYQRTRWQRRRRHRCRRRQQLQQRWQHQHHHQRLKILRHMSCYIRRMCMKCTVWFWNWTTIYPLVVPELALLLHLLLLHPVSLKTSKWTRVTSICARKISSAGEPTLASTNVNFMAQMLPSKRSTANATLLR